MDCFRTLLLFFGCKFQAGQVGQVGQVGHGHEGKHGTCLPDLQEASFLELKVLCPSASAERTLESLAARKLPFTGLNKSLVDQLWAAVFSLHLPVI